MSHDAYISAGAAAQARKIDALEEKLHRITQWCDAYPLEVFPEPDLVVARQLLEAGGVNLDAISASNMRHVLDGVRKIIDTEKG
jgi:hypothetical protein